MWSNFDADSAMLCGSEQKSHYYRKMRIPASKRPGSKSHGLVSENGHFSRLPSKSGR